MIRVGLATVRRMRTTAHITGGAYVDQGQCKLLDRVVVIDAAQGMCTTLIAKFLKELGATVIRAEVADADPFLDVYPAMRAWRDGFLAPDSPSLNWADLAANADVLILGGEDYPGLARTGAAAEYAARNPRLVALEVTALPKGMPGPPCVANEVMIQARAGLVWEYYHDRPVRFAFSPATYGAVLQGLSAIVAGLVARERTGRGQAVWTSLFDGALTYASSLWLEAEHPTTSARLVVPKDPRPLVLECADGKYIHIFLGVPAAALRFYEVLGLTPPPEGVHLWTSADSRYFFGRTEDVENAVAQWKRDDLIKALLDAQVTAGAVLAPGECWTDPQIVEQGFITKASSGERMVGAPLKADAAAKGEGLAPISPDAGPLSGLSIVDFGTYVAGPYGGVVLSDLGADVIKVEPSEGDAGRGMYRVFSTCNRGKRTIKLDLKHPSSAEILQRLCDRADGVISNFRTGVSRRRKVDAHSLHPSRPELVIVECPAYGSTGPRAQDPGYDPIMQAWTGHEVRQGGVGNNPVWTRFTEVDYSAGAVARIAMLAGLYHRAATGAGHAITSSLVGAGLALMSELIQAPNGEFKGAPLLDARQRGLHPAEALYRTQDGWLAVVAPSGDSARALASALGLHALAEQPRATWGDAAFAELDAAFERCDTSSALALLEAAGVWCEPCAVGRDSEWMSHQFLRDQGVVKQRRHPRMGELTEIGLLFRMERSATGGQRPPPEPGEHTRDILLELGYSLSEVDTLFAERVVS